MTDTAIGFLIVGIGHARRARRRVRRLVAAAARPERAADPPRGVHLPPPSFLPVVLSVGAALIGAGLAFRSRGSAGEPVPRDPRPA